MLSVIIKKSVILIVLRLRFHSMSYLPNFAALTASNSSKIYHELIIYNFTSLILLVCQRGNKNMTEDVSFKGCTYKSARRRDLCCWCLPFAG